MHDVSNGKSDKRPYAADMVATGFALGVFISASVFDVEGYRWLTLLGLIVLATAVPLFVLPFFHLRRYGMPISGRPFHETTRMVHVGLYSVVRHPQYVGYTHIMLGLALVNPHPVTMILAAVGAVFLYAQAVSEERFCRDAFGREYDEYARAIPRCNVPLGLLRAVKRSRKRWE
jgi:protein-S-isoprenylcysteine O-methyltransferase Ste14